MTHKKGVPLVWVRGRLLSFFASEYLRLRTGCGTPFFTISSFHSSCQVTDSGHKKKKFKEWVQDGPVAPSAMRIEMGRPSGLSFGLILFVVCAVWPLFAHMTSPHVRRTWAGAPSSSRASAWLLAADAWKLCIPPCAPPLLLRSPSRAVMSFTLTRSGGATATRGEQ